MRHEKRLRDLFPQEVWTLIYEFEGAARPWVHFPLWFISIYLRLDKRFTIRNYPETTWTVIPVYYNTRTGRMHPSS